MLCDVLCLLSVNVLSSVHYFDLMLTFMSNDHNERVNGSVDVILQVTRKAIFLNVENTLQVCFPFLSISHMRVACV